MLTARKLQNHLLKNVSFDMRKGEIVGFYGLVGAGKTEIARAIFGADSYEGEITFKSRPLGHTPQSALAAGIALVPEERRTQGLFTAMSIRENIPVMNLPRMSNRGVFRADEEERAAHDFVARLGIATDSIEKHTEKLSGGNQKKVCSGKVSVFSS